jgi:hypothetical protein
MSSARKRAIVEASVPETPLFDGEGLETLAGALCLVAAGAHSKDPANQEQIAAQFFACAISGFEGMRPDAMVAAFVKDMCDRAKKK